VPLYYRHHNHSKTNKLINCPPSHTYTAVNKHWWWRVSSVCQRRA